MDFDTLYQEVLARPEDDGARRVLAEFLSEQGDPLGELIRVQCDLAEKGPKAPRGLRVAEAQLLAEHRTAWHTRFAPWATEVAFARGFPALAWTTVSWLRKQGNNGAALPSLGLVIELERHDLGGHLATLPIFERVTTLELSRGLIRGSREQPPLETFWELIAACPRLTGLHLDELHLERDARALLALPQLDRLTELSLRRLDVPELIDQLLARLGRSQSLQSLDLTGGENFEGQEIAALARFARHSTSLRRLVLDFCWLNSGLLRPITEAVHAGGSAVVSVSHNSGLQGAWLTDPAVARSVRGNLEDHRLTLSAADPARAPLGRIGAWDLIDLAGHKNGTGRWLAKSGERRALLSHHVASSASTGPSANELSEFRRWLDTVARRVVGLPHANLVRWLDYGVHGAGLYVVHELGDFLPAEQVINEQLASGERFTPSQVARIGLDVCRGLLALHQTGHLHGAVNETTVFISPSGGARLLPLGFDAPSYYGPGAFRFLSPEQVKGKTRGPASDLFQLGVLLHTLIAQRHPYLRRTEGDMLNAIVGQDGQLPSALPSSVPPALREYLDRLLATDPQFRPDSAEEVLMELAMRANLPMTGTPEPPPPDDVPWLDRAVTLARTFALWGPVIDRGD